MSQDGADATLEDEIQFSLDINDFQTVPDSLEDAASEQRPSDGRGLFLFAVFKAAERLRKELEPGYQLTADARRKLLAAVDKSDAAAQVWSELGDARRTWISHAHQWFPVPWEGLKRKVPPFDVYCNDDEVQYTWGPRPKYSEDGIRDRYREQWDGLGKRRKFNSEARRINHAKGYRHAIRNWQPYFFPQPPSGENDDNVYARDLRYISKVFGHSENCHWYFAGVLGRGAYGETQRYDFIDQNNTVRRRIVVKRDFTHSFSNDYERKLGSMLKDKSPYILNYLTPGSRAAQGRPGVGYMEYAPHGDLSNVIVKYAKNGWVIPETFCWYLLHALAEACCVMELGRRPDEPPVDNWKSIFHFDLKPSNILLNAPQTNRAGYWWQRNYPTPMVADLGGAARYPNDVQKKPDYYRIINSKSKYRYKHSDYHHVAGFGTHGYRPFELFSFPEQAKANQQRQKAKASVFPYHQKIRIHTTIFQVGLVLYRAMSKDHCEQLFHQDAVNPAQDYQKRHQNRYGAPPFHRGLDKIGDPSADDDDDERPQPYSPENALLPHYSHKLIELVWRCMSPLAADRIKPTALWNETSKMMAEIDRMWPDPASVAPKTTTNNDDDELDDDVDLGVLDYRSDSDDNNQPDDATPPAATPLQSDPRSAAAAAAAYEDMREQFADVDPSRVPALYRDKHTLHHDGDPVARQLNRTHARREARRRALDRRWQAYWDKLDYAHAVDRELAAFRLRMSLRLVAGWAALSPAQQARFEAQHVEKWRKALPVDVKTFSPEELDDIEQPESYEVLPSSDDGGEEDDDDDDAEVGYEFSTFAAGKLMRRGPRMLAMPWDGRPVGARVLNPGRKRSLKWLVDADSSLWDLDWSDMEA